MQDARYKMQEARCKMQDARCKMQDAKGKMQKARCNMQDARCKMLNARCKDLKRFGIVTFFQRSKNIIKLFSFKNHKPFVDCGIHSFSV